MDCLGSVPTMASLEGEFNHIGYEFCNSSNVTLHSKTIKDLIFLSVTLFCPCVLRPTYGGSLQLTNVAGSVLVPGISFSKEINCMVDVDEVHDTYLPSSS